MELHQLRYFLAVVDEGSFTAAAQAMRISQSGISTQLQKLERELGVPLIDRSARRIALTPAGSSLVAPARNAIAAVAGVTDAALAIRGLVVGALRIATVTGLVWPRLFDALAAVHTEHPGIDLRLHEGTSDAAVQGVRDGSVDVAVAAWADEEPYGVELSVDRRRPTGGGGRSRAPVGGACPAPRRRARPRRSRHPSRRHRIPRRAGRAPPPPDRSAGGTALGGCHPGVRADARRRGLGIGVVSATTAADWYGVAVLPIDDPGARSRLGVVWRSSPSHAARALLGHLVGDAQSS